MSKLGEKRVAIVHDELTRRGGAEIVLEELIRIFPQAEIYALYAGRPWLSVDGRVYQVKTSMIQKLPWWFRRHPSRVLPLLASAAEEFDLSEYDLVVSSSSGFAKGVVTRVDVPHVCYCHTPTRYLWDDTHTVIRRAKRGSRWLLRVLLHYLRMADFAAAQRVDFLISNSEYTKYRLQRYYHRDSQVIYPPIDTKFYFPLAKHEETRPANKSFLAVGRLTPAKNFEQAIKVCRKLNLPLTVVGSGRLARKLRRLSNAKIKLVGEVSRTRLRELFRQSRALIQPGIEDFGMSAAEALACGLPVIALGEGGINEIVEDNISGILYQGSHEEALAEAIRRFISYESTFDREAMQRSVMRFSRLRFQREIRSMLADLLDLEQQRRRSPIQQEIILP